MQHYFHLLRKPMKFFVVLKLLTYILLLLRLVTANIQSSVPALRNNNDERRNTNWDWFLMNMASNLPHVSRPEVKWLYQHPWNYFSRRQLLRKPMKFFVVLKLLTYILLLLRLVTANIQSSVPDRKSVV